MAQDLDRPAVPGRAAVGDDDAVARLLRRADAGEADAGCNLGVGSSYFVNGMTTRPTDVAPGAPVTEANALKGSMKGFTSVS